MKELTPAELAIRRLRIITETIEMDGEWPYDRIVRSLKDVLQETGDSLGMRVPGGGDHVPKLQHGTEVTNIWQESPQGELGMCICGAVVAETHNGWTHIPPLYNTAEDRGWMDERT